MHGKQFRVQLQETATLELYYQENTSLHVDDELANFHTVEWERYGQASLLCLRREVMLFARSWPNVALEGADYGTPLALKKMMLITVMMIMIIIVIIIMMIMIYKKTEKSNIVSYMSSLLLFHIMKK